MAGFTRFHFIGLAAVFAQLRRELHQDAYAIQELDHVVTTVSAMLARDNPAFNADRFWAAYMVESVKGPRDPYVYHPHRTDGLDRNLSRINEADFRAGVRCTCPHCLAKYADSREWLRASRARGSAE